MQFLVLRDLRSTEGCVSQGNTLSSAFGDILPSQGGRAVAKKSNGAGRLAGMGCTPSEFGGASTTSPTAQLAGGLWRADADARRGCASALTMTALVGAQGQP